MSLLSEVRVHYLVVERHLRSGHVGASDGAAEMRCRIERGIEEVACKRI